MGRWLAHNRGDRVFSGVNMTADRRAWLVLAFGVVVAALLLDVLVRHDPISVDFHTYVAAGQVGLEKGWSDIYDQGLVAVEQKELSSSLWTQPFLSPPTVAFLITPLAFLPYNAAYLVWAVLLFALYAAALVWAGVSTGWGRWIAVVGALAPWWVMQAINVGQVVPLEAAGTVVAWRLMRERRDVLAGVALAAILFKPNNAVLVPIALLFAHRFRLIATWAGVAVAVLIVVVLTVGTGGIDDYIAQLRGPLPAGADNLTLHGALAVTGVSAMALRVIIIAAVMAAAYRMRGSPGLVIPIAVVGSLLVSPYLHVADLCMLGAAGWMMWEERPALTWRLLLVGMWLLASPYLYDTGAGLHSTQWPWVELALLVVLLIAAWSPLTGWAASGRRAPA